MRVLNKILTWHTTPESYPLNCVIFIASFMASGMFFSTGFTYISLDFIWSGVIEYLYGSLLMTIGIWQLTIFLNKYIYYRAVIKPNILKNNGVSNEF